MFDAVLIANRGEIAVRVIRACKELGIRSVAVYSEADRAAPHVRLADEAHLLGPAPAAESYLRTDRIIDIALAAGVDAIHPGYGFLSENAEFARAVADAGLVFVGPSPEAIESMGDKLTARQAAIAADVPVVPGTPEAVTDVGTALAFGEEHGYPVAVKAMFGGGGRGLKVVRSAEQMREALEAAQREAAAAFGNGACYLERYLERPRHIEVQILGDLDGTVIHLGERDCSLQRRHQKLVEEAPAPGLAPHVREQMAQAAVRLARKMGYHNAGTCEFLLDADGETFYFLEMNTRLQVEHPVTEMVTGVDLVHQQLRIAAGDGMGLTQDDVRPRGHAIEVRINAEDPSAGFLPTPGRIDVLRAPQGPWVRLDTGAESGYEVPREYDSMVGKLIVWGEDRDTARRRMRRALDETVLTGIESTLPFHALAMEHEQFAAGTHATTSVEAEWDLSELPERPEAAEPAAAAPAAPAPRSREVELLLNGVPTLITVYGAPVENGTATASRSGRRRSGRAGGGAGGGADSPELRAPMQGTVIKYAVEVGDTVSPGDLVAVVEAMKMETPVVARRAGTITHIGFSAGDAVESGAVLARIEDAAR
ncbi:MAG TPA: acetyl-CoA carboxylase biotin carboxylase subunit [Thermobifida alba]|nr:acetyl-CoA carboxylase biotin carboxylase subunit [Thermobifida alba]